jgi:hypothetical protein
MIHQLSLQIPRNVPIGGDDFEVIEPSPDERELDL